MAKKLQILLMIFCLGIFIFPKQAFLMQRTEMNCCQKEQPSKECCSKDAAPKEKKQDRHSCEGNCAKCSGCSVSVVFLSVSMPSLQEKKSSVITQKVEKAYLQPSLSIPYQSIWQPPKIG